MKKLILASAISAFAAGPVHAAAGTFEIGQAGKVDVTAYGALEMRGAYAVDEKIGDALAGYARAVHTDDGGRWFQDNQGQIDFSVESSRVGFLAKHESGAQVRIETDFIDRDDSGGVRIRHAYAEFENWLVGQTWTQVRSPIGRIQTVDFEGETGVGIEERVAQIRYTSGPWSLALEEQRSHQNIDLAIHDKDYVWGWGETDTIRFPNQWYDVFEDQKQKLPALTGAYESAVADGVNVRISGVMARYTSEINVGEFVDGTAPMNTSRKKESAVGYGMFAGSNIELTDDVTLAISASYANGANSYVNATSSIPDAIQNNRNGDLKTVKSVGGAVGINVAVGPGKLGASYSISKNDAADAVDAEFVRINVIDSSIEKTRIAFLNYHWQPRDGMTAGVEYAHYFVDENGGRSGEAGRINAKLAVAF